MENIIIFIKIQKRKYKKKHQNQMLPWLIITMISHN
jgi:hypothetical protein